MCTSNSDAKPIFQRATNIVSDRNAMQKGPCRWLVNWQKDIMQKTNFVAGKKYMDWKSLWTCLYKERGIVLESEVELSVLEGGRVWGKEVVGNEVLA